MNERLTNIEKINIEKLHRKLDNIINNAENRIREKCGDITFIRQIERLRNEAIMKSVLETERRRWRLNK